MEALSEASLGPSSSSLSVTSHSIAPSSPSPSSPWQASPPYATGPGAKHQSGSGDSPDHPAVADSGRRERSPSDSWECSAALGSCVQTANKPSTSQPPTQPRDSPATQTHWTGPHPSASQKHSVPHMHSRSPSSSSEHHCDPEERLHSRPQSLRSTPLSQHSPCPAPLPAPCNQTCPGTDPAVQDSMLHSPADPSLTPRPPSPSLEHRPARPMPVERWAENVTRYYNYQNALQSSCGLPCEELSELESLYRASLRAPSMPRGTRGASPQPTGRQGIASFKESRLRFNVLTCYYLTFKNLTFHCNLGQICFLSSKDFLYFVSYDGCL